MLEGKPGDAGGNRGDDEEPRHSLVPRPDRGCRQKIAAVEHRFSLLDNPEYPCAGNPGLLARLLYWRRLAEEIHGGATSRIMRPHQPTDTTEGLLSGLVSRQFWCRAPGTCNRSRRRRPQYVLALACNATG